MGRLTTHVLDTSSGKPAGNMKLTLYRIDGDVRHAITERHTNADGRCDAPLLDGDAFKVGTYQLAFEVSAYFTAEGHKLPEPPFLSTVILTFSISDSHAHYHVPLLVSPWSYSTYRGS